jgi:hypothetical protein
MRARRKHGIIARAGGATQAGISPAKPLIPLRFRGELFSSKKPSPIH